MAIICNLHLIMYSSNNKDNIYLHPTTRNRVPMAMLYRHTMFIIQDLTHLTICRCTVIIKDHTHHSIHMLCINQEVEILVLLLKWVIKITMNPTMASIAKAGM